MKKNILTAILFFVCSFLNAQVKDFHHKSSGKSIRNKFLKESANTVSTPGNGNRRTCYTMNMDTLLRKKFPQLGTIEDFEKKFSAEIRNKKMTNARTSGVVYTIPVIVHIIHNGQEAGVGSNISAAQIQSQFDVLNEDFRRKPGTPGFNSNAVGADMEIEFAPALFDPSGNPLAEPGIDRINGGRASWNSFNDVEGILKPQTIWDPNQYFNIWVVNFGGEMAQLLGYAQFPSLTNLDGLDNFGGLAATDGVVCRHTAFGKGGTTTAPYNQGRTMTHEVGHWLGLRHIWGDVINQCDHPQDYCDDTPKAKDKNFGCPVGLNSCVSFSSSDRPDMIENYMDYTDDVCMNIFTQDQKTRMRTAMELSPRRKELLSSKVYISGNKPIAFFDVSNRTICTGSSILFSDQSQNDPTSWKWEIIDGLGRIVNTITLQNFNGTFNGPGVFDVRLIVSNSSGIDTLLKENLITVLSNTNSPFPFAESFEQSSFLPNWILFNPDKDVSWQRTNQASANGSGNSSLVFNNYESTVDLGGKFDVFISNKLNLQTNQDIQLSFDVAYAQYDDLYNDTLILFASTDCGATFVPFWFKGGKDLATAPNTESSFTPNIDQWRKERISLSFLNGNSSVYIAFANLSGWGNKLYIDNIRLDDVSITQKPFVLYYASNTDVCQDGVVQFTDTTENFPTSWLWEFPGGTPSTSSLQNPAIKYSVPGRYDVNLIASNGLGSDSWLRENYINVIPKPTISISANKTTICVGDSVLLTANGAADYTWYDERENIISGNDRVWVYPTQNATYKVVGADIKGCKNTATRSIEVNLLPAKPVITLNGSRLSASVISAVTYQWYSSSAMINGATGNSYLPTANGIYYVTVTNASGCSVRSDNFNYTITNTYSFTEGASSLLIYPNPVKGILNIEIKGSATIRLNSLQGSTIATYACRDKTSIDISSFAKGAYVIEVIGSNSIQRKMVVLEY